MNVWRCAKLNDNEIIKALECCKRAAVRQCEGCPYKERSSCAFELRRDALDLINRQQAEIERLKLEVEAVDELINPLPFKSNFDRAIETAKSEAIKEFAERLKGMHRHNTTSVTSLVTVFDNINNLVKEMTE